MIPSSIARDLVRYPTGKPPNASRAVKSFLVVLRTCKSYATSPHSQIKIKPRSGILASADPSRGNQRIHTSSGVKWSMEAAFAFVQPHCATESTKSCLALCKYYHHVTGWRNKDVRDRRVGLLPAVSPRKPRCGRKASINYRGEPSRTPYA